MRILYQYLWFGRHSRLATLLSKLMSTLRCEVPSVISVVDGAGQMSLTSGEIADVNLNKVLFRVEIYYFCFFNFFFSIRFFPCELFYVLISQ